MQKILFSLVLTLACTVAGQSQYLIDLLPRSSPNAMMMNTVGYTEVIVQYSAPSVRNRTVWGELLPYGEIWRAGANEATKVTFSTDVTIEENLVPAGDYALFIIPKATSLWTVILNKEADQWGAFNYHQEEDLLRIEVPVEEVDSKQERLKFEIIDNGFGNGEILLLWEQVALSIPFQTDYLNELEYEIESRLAAADQHMQWVIYLQGAEFLVNQDEKLDIAMAWLNNATSEFEKHASNYKDNKEYFRGHINFVKGRAYFLKQDYQESLRYLDMVKSMTGAKSFYNLENDEEGIEDLYQQVKMLANSK